MSSTRSVKRRLDTYEADGENQINKQRKILKRAGGSRGSQAPANLPSSDQEGEGAKDVTGTAREADHHVPSGLLCWHMPEIEGGEVYYMPNFISSELADEWYSTLLELCPWYHPKLKVYGKEVTQSRSIAAYTSNKGMTSKYSGHVVDIQYGYPPILTEIQKRVEATLGEAFNYVMLNRYDSGKEYIGKHRDTKENKVIVSLSLGAERTFIMSPDKSNPAAKPHRWTLQNGSLLVMRGATQDNWKHEIPKEPKIKSGRISLTFRQLSSQ